MAPKQLATKAASSESSNGTPTKRRTRSRSRRRTTSESKKKTHKFHYEFGGPAGALSTMISLPIVVYGLYYLCRGSCTQESGFCLSQSNYESISAQLPRSLEELWDLKALWVALSWIGFHAVLERALPGPRVPGTELSTGERLLYPLNGHLAFWVSLLCVCFFPNFGENGLVQGTLFELSYAYDHYVHLATASLLISIVLSGYLYVRSFASGALLAPHGNSGNPVYDFFIGRELNPRIGSFDLKYFCELRPGLIGWTLINVGCMMKQYSLRGHVTGAMLLVNVFQGLYVWDALYNERAILTTMDIINDGFGYMLAFGDLCWVPFTYSLQARYLVENDGAEGYALVAICILNAIGYWIFRGSNGQKDTFRRDPKDPAVRHLETISTKRGRKLLVSGWWGVARKINYTGDWLMGLSWCLFTGFGSIVPYFYAIYFAILLIHRAMRDDDQCSRKYGTDWPKYKAKVPYVFVPGVI